MYVCVEVCIWVVRREGLDFVCTKDFHHFMVDKANPEKAGVFENNILQHF